MEDALLPPKRQVARSNRAEPTSSFSNLQSVRGLVYRPCPHRCPHGTGFFRLRPAKFTPEADFFRRAPGLCRRASATPPGRLQRVEPHVEHGECRGRGIRRTLASANWLAIFVSQQRPRRLGPPGLTPHPKLFWFFRVSSGRSGAQWQSRQGRKHVLSYTAEASGAVESPWTSPPGGGSLRRARKRTRESPSSSKNGTPKIKVTDWPSILAGWNALSQHVHEDQPDAVWRR